MENAKSSEELEYPFRVSFDHATKKWFKQHPGHCSTVMKCNDCGLFYKPSLGHKCKVKKVDKNAE